VLLSHRVSPRRFVVTIPELSKNVRKSKEALAGDHEIKLAYRFHAFIYHGLPVAANEVATSRFRTERFISLDSEVSQMRRLTLKRY
jgi:hypothetical protein